MKPTKMRNKLIYHATLQTKNKQVASPLSKQLSAKYQKKSARVVKGDSVKITRGEFKGVDGKVAQISVKNSTVAIEGTKKEKTKGDKFDVYIHASNVLITSLNTSDGWRMKKLEKRSSSKAGAKDDDAAVQKGAEQDTVVQNDSDGVTESDGNAAGEDTSQAEDGVVKSGDGTVKDDGENVVKSDDGMTGDGAAQAEDGVKKAEETSIFQSKEDKA